MTRFEYLQLRVIILSYFQREKLWLLVIIFGITFFMACFFSLLIFLPFIIPFGVASRTWEHFTDCLMKIPIFLPAIFICLFLYTYSYWQINTKYASFLEKLGDAWKAGKSVEETLALPEFEKFFPKKSSLPPGPIGFENEI